uniref:ATP-binding protein n=1 Tax=Marinobacterium profundum TaxID=1714300 RepID=UPI000A994CA6|nr:ATP-binding protein [Marinobacterium profundum]
MSSRREKIAPRASVLIESMRDIGYSLQTAVADVIDNSITAGARSICLLANTHSIEPAFAVLDNGSGMTEIELIEAMRPGSKSPLSGRSLNDLGRFGLGLKTASFSQCRRLTVLTRKNGQTSCAIWDLDVVAKTDEWYVDLVSDYNDIPWSDELKETGTLVIWQKIDRLVDPKCPNDRQNFIRELDEAASHVELVYHRFLAGEAGLKKISMSLNGRKLNSVDPFNSKNPATIFGPEDVFRLGNQEIKIQPVTLPHHKKVTAEEWNRYAGSEGYIKNQGFYLYRGKRLIIYGTWFNLARQTELTKLARVRIDMPNSMDFDWKIDVKKASAQPPAPVRERLRRIIDVIGAGSKRTYTERGKRLISANRLPVWNRIQDKNKVFYGLNAEHPAFTCFSSGLSVEKKREFGKLLELVGSTIPIDTIFADISSNPEAIDNRGMDEESFLEVTRMTYLTLKSGEVEDEDIALIMSSAEPFKSMWKKTAKIIDSIKKDCVNEGRSSRP